jgi:hypothetical protein
MEFNFMSLVKHGLVFGGHKMQIHVIIKRLFPRSLTGIG